MTEQKRHDRPHQKTKAAQGAGQDRRSSRLAVAYALLRVTAGSGYSNIVADHSFADLTDPRDRAFAGTLFYGVLERLIQLDHIIAAYCKKPLDRLDAEVLCILRLSVYQLLYLDSVPDSAAVNEGVRLARQMGKGSASGFVNGVLRAFVRQGKPDLPGGHRLDSLARLSVRASAPEPLCRLLIDQYGEETAEAFLLNSLEPAPVYIRQNPTRTTETELLALLCQQGAAAAATDLPGCIRLDRAGDLTAYAAFAQGLFHVQDRSSQLCCLLLDARPGMRVLDVCAAPGGKSFTIAGQMQDRGQLVACDLYPGRVGLIRSGAGRLGLDCIQALTADAAVYAPELGEFDRVLCDVPCSGLGIIRRKPEIKYKDTDSFRQLPEQQYRILETAARYLKPGGRLIYSTCTLNRAENEEVVRRFLQQHTGFLPDPIGEDGGYCRTLLPQNEGGDGFFIAAVRRAK